MNEHNFIRNILFLFVYLSVCFLIKVAQKNIMHNVHKLDLNDYDPSIKYKGH